MAISPKRSCTSLLLLCCVVIITTLTGCFGGEEKPEEVTEGEHADASHSTGSSYDEGDEEEGGEEEGPTQPQSPAAPATEVELIRKTAFTPLTFTLSGRTQLTGWLVTPKLQEQALKEAMASDDDEEEGEDEEDEAPPTERRPLVILLHGLNGSYRDWVAFPWRLVEKGYAVLALDMRGHGSSRPNGIDWRQFRPEAWQQLPKDLLAIIHQMREVDARAVAKGLESIEEEPYPSPLLNHLDVDPNRITVVGAGVGANVALLGVRQALQLPQPEKAQGLMLLSPTLAYKGLRTLEEAFYIDMPSMIVASQSDPSAYHASQMLYRMMSGEKSLEIYQSIGHGTDMVQFFPELQTKLLDWLTQAMPPTAEPIPASIFASEEEEEEE